MGNIEKQDSEGPKGGKECCDEVYEDDGRYTYEDPSEHKGDWGQHSDDDDED